MSYPWHFGMHCVSFWIFYFKTVRRHRLGVMGEFYKDSKRELQLHNAARILKMFCKVMVTNVLGVLETQCMPDDGSCEWQCKTTTRFMQTSPASNCNNIEWTFTACIHLMFSSYHWAGCQTILHPTVKPFLQPREEPADNATNSQLESTKRTGDHSLETFSNSVSGRVEVTSTKWSNGMQRKSIVECGTEWKWSHRDQQRWEARVNTAATVITPVCRHYR